MADVARGDVPPPIAREGGAPGDVVVSVVVPAYNAERTLEETLRSAVAQTFSAIEIVVVDDGSEDGTREIVAKLAAADPRIRLVGSANAGVASARNLGIRHARGRYVAPLDADDIWHPTKLEKQLAVIERDPALGFVYCFSDFIDADSRVIGRPEGYASTGRPLLEHCFYNFVGNGSAMLMPRDLAIKLGGYAPALRDLGLEGCEDYLLQLRSLRSRPVACVPERLVGYRRLAGNMSFDFVKMAKSEALVLRIGLAGLPPEAHWAIAPVLFKVDCYLLRKAYLAAEWRLAGATLRSMLSREPALPTLARTAYQTGRVMISSLADQLRAMRPGGAAAAAKFGEVPMIRPTRFGKRFWDKVDRLREADRTLPCLDDPRDPDLAAFADDALVRALLADSRYAFSASEGPGRSIGAFVALDPVEPDLSGMAS
jgi:hypothetical protein